MAVAKNVTLPPNSEAFFIQGKTEGDSTHLLNAIVEPTTILDNSNMLVARSLVDPSNGTVPLRIVNTSDIKQVIYANKRLATCESLPSFAEIKQNDKADTEPHKVRNIHRDWEISDTLPNHLINLFEKSCLNLSEEQSAELKQLLKRHSDAFAKSKNDLGRSDLIKHKINTGDAVPIKQNPRRLPFAKRKETDREIQRMLRQRYN